MSDKKKNIVFFLVSSYFLKNNCFSYINSLDHEKYNIYILTNYDGTHNKEFFSKKFTNKAQLHHVKVSRGGKNPIEIFFEIIRIFRSIKIIDPDIVHNFGLKGSFIGSIVSRFLKIKNINSITGLGYNFNNKNLKSFLIRNLISFVLSIFLNSKYSIITVETENAKKRVQEYFHLSSKKIYVIQGVGVDTEKIRYKEIINLEGEIIFLMASRVLIDKGVIEFCSAAKKAKANSLKARFILIGSEDPENQSYISINELKIIAGNSVQFIPFKESVIKDLENCHVFVLPSYHEGLSLGLMEANAVGRPAICSDISGCRETIQNNFNGLLVKKSDAEDLYQKIHFFLKNKNLIKEFGINGKKMIDDNFSLSKISPLYQQLY